MGSTAFRRLVVSAMTTIGVSTIGVAANAQEWARFRGPNGGGVSADGGSIPSTWTESDYAWRVKLPGAGHSQPVIWGEKLFVTCASEEGQRRHLVCLQAADGKSIWSVEFSMATHTKHGLNSFASNTPAVDAARLYAIFTDPQSFVVRAFDHGGKEIWKRELGGCAARHGSGASPILFDGLVIVAKDLEADSAVFALDQASGEVRWKTERRSSETAYGTPCLLERAGKPAQLILSSQSHGLSALDARTGTPLWDSASVFDKRTVSSPVLADGLAIGTCGSGGGGNYLAAVRLDGAGDVSERGLAYKLTHSIPYVPTPVVDAGRLYLWNERGIVSCYDAKDGSPVWRERIDGNFYGSPVLIGQRLYSASTDGQMAVIDVSGGAFKPLGASPIGEGSHSSPAVAGGRLFIHTFNHVVAIGGKKAAAAAPAGGD
jgi:outer membrane protein assembly factor BamB